MDIETIETCVRFVSPFFSNPQFSSEKSERQSGGRTACVGQWLIPFLISTNHGLLKSTLPPFGAPFSLFFFFYPHPPPVSELIFNVGWEAALLSIIPAICGSSTNIHFFLSQFLSVCASPAPTLVCAVAESSSRWSRGSGSHTDLSWRVSFQAALFFFFFNAQVFLLLFSFLVTFFLGLLIL